ncbi:hypothetical protein B0H94_101214 [Salsuginibacillus halophilus]|uniref:Cytosolic protein n=1 Tax=Salsuginibacillus halophilus TaxID=517424 RepID=A0A2P8HYJ4_9BACI|nr:hypothetical protein [Salsuginibacillus halophilus]PSL51301.1 hypothetical protein B0H94_101214 [Salsuginibacillus halophilus]
MTKKSYPEGDISTAQDQVRFLQPEDLPEGPYGAPRNKNEPVQDKETPSHRKQQTKSAFTYEDRELHAGLERKHPGAHDTHAEKHTTEL